MWSYTWNFENMTLSRRLTSSGVSAWGPKKWFPHGGFGCGRIWQVQGAIVGKNCIRFHLRAPEWGRDVFIFAEPSLNHLESNEKKTIGPRIFGQASSHDLSWRFLWWRLLWLRWLHTCHSNMMIHNAYPCSCISYSSYSYSFNFIHLIPSCSTCDRTWSKMNSWNTTSSIIFSSIVFASFLGIKVELGDKVSCWGTIKLKRLQHFGKLRKPSSLHTIINKYLLYPLAKSFQTYCWWKDIPHQGTWIMPTCPNFWLGFWYSAGF